MLNQTPDSQDPIFSGMAPDDHGSYVMLAGTQFEMNGSTYGVLGALLFAAVGTTVILYRGVLFGDDDGVLLINTYTTAIIFGASAFGSKLLSSDYPTGPRRLTFVKSHPVADKIISYVGIGGLTALFGFLMYVINIFDPTASPYSDLLYYCSHALVGIITAAIVTMSWIISSKL